MRVLVACEESQVVCKAFRERGHEAFSCDIQPCSGGHPEWHLQIDALDAINYMNWDLMIAHPPCTYLTNAGIGYFNVAKYGLQAVNRRMKREEAFLFFMQLYKSPIKKICIENPVGYPNTAFRKPNQTIHPWFFGDPHMKRTCLWLRGLPRLNGNPKNTQPQPLHVGIRRAGKHYNGGEIKNRYFVDVQSSMSGKQRSKTFPGIAKAMAEQWG